MDPESYCTVCKSPRLNQLKVVISLYVQCYTLLYMFTLPKFLVSILMNATCLILSQSLTGEGEECTSVSPSG
jgi:hypothetical protein